MFRYPHQWLATDANKTTKIDKNLSASRYARMAFAAKRLGAVLFIIPESDKAWMLWRQWLRDPKVEARPGDPPSEAEVEEAYSEQAEVLKAVWIPIIERFIP